MACMWDVVLADELRHKDRPLEEWLSVALDVVHCGQFGCRLQSAASQQSLEKYLREAWPVKRDTIWTESVSQLISKYREGVLR